MLQPRNFFKTTENPTKSAKLEKENEFFEHLVLKRGEDYNLLYRSAPRTYFYSTSTMSINGDIENKQFEIFVKQASQAMNELNIASRNQAFKEITRILTGFAEFVKVMSSSMK